MKINQSQIIKELIKKHCICWKIYEIRGLVDPKCGIHNLEEVFRDSLASFEAEIREEMIEKIEKVSHNEDCQSLSIYSIHKSMNCDCVISEIVDQLSSLSAPIKSGSDKKVDNFSDYPEQEQKEIVEKATKESNKMQKNIYYKIKPKNYDNFWICDEKQLKQDIADWIEEGEGVTITPIEMSVGEFKAIPEYQG